MTSPPQVSLAPTAPTTEAQVVRPAKRRKTATPTPPTVASPTATTSSYRVPTDREHAFRLLRDRGFRNPEQVGVPRPTSITFKADNRETCPCCSLDHEHHNWWVAQAPDGVLLVRSYSDRCRVVPIQPVVEVAGDVAAAQALIAQRLDLVERRQGQTELDVTVIRNTLVDFGPHIETALNQRITPNSVVLRPGGGSFDFRCEVDRADYLCEILVNPTCRLSCTSDDRISPTVAGWVGNETLNNIINSERADTAYVEAWSLHERRQLGVEWRCDDAFYHSTGLSWTRVDNEQYLEQRILALLRPALGALNQLASAGLAARGHGPGGEEAHQGGAAPGLQPHPEQPRHAGHPQVGEDAAPHVGLRLPHGPVTATSWGRHPERWTCAPGSSSPPPTSRW